MNFLRILPTLSVGIVTGLMVGVTTKNLSGGIVTAIPVSVVATKFSERDNDRIRREIDSTNSQKAKLQHKIEKLERVESDLQSKIDQLQEQLRLALKTAKQAQETTVAISDQKEGLERQLGQANETLSDMTHQRDNAVARIQELSDGMEQQIASAIDEGLDAEYKRQLSEMWVKSEDLIQRAIDAALRFKEWGTAAEMFNSGLQETASNIETNAQRGLKRIYDTLEEEKQRKSEEIDLLNAKLYRLELQKRGELTEPIYLPRRYDIANRVANDLAKEFWAIAEMPLEVQGVKSTNGDIKIGFGYSKSIDPDLLIRTLNTHAPKVQAGLRLAELGRFTKLDYANILTVTARTEPRDKDSDISHLVGSSSEFIRYVTTNPWRYRLIADPGAGKTPTTAVMVAKMLEAGARMGNVPKGKKVPHTLVSVSYPGANSSLKDGDNYPLSAFLKYGDQTQAVKSFRNAIDDYEFRVQNPRYASEFFHLYVWDEFDNTISDADDGVAIAKRMKKLLKQGGHNNIGYIVSGQSVMTKTIPGFMTDDRSLFTEIVIGVNKIRTYLNAYGKGKGSDETVGKIAQNLDVIEQHMESKNRLITDSARELRLGLVVANQSPKLFFLPNFDEAIFEPVIVSKAEAQAQKMQGQIGSKIDGLWGDSELTLNENGQAESLTVKEFDSMSQSRVKTDIGGCGSLSDPLPHCSTCDIPLGNERSDGRRRCKQCKKVISPSKFIYK